MMSYIHGGLISMVTLHPWWPYSHAGPLHCISVLEGPWASPALVWSPQEKWEYYRIQTPNAKAAHKVAPREDGEMSEMMAVGSSR